MPARTALTHTRCTPNFDPLARLYRWMEYFSFGPMLERCRFHFLPECFDARQALLLGDGDGRFTARLLGSNQKVQVDAIDSSGAMLHQLEHRAGAASTTGPARLRTLHSDIRDAILDRGEYDLVVSHFFLDCLTDDEIAALIEDILPYMTPDATWLVSEFAIPEQGWRRNAARVLVRLLYFAFGIMTRLQVRKIPDYSSILTRSGFRLQQQNRLLGGLLVTEVWMRKKN